jgi:hypothetical protein
MDRKERYMTTVIALIVVGWLAITAYKHGKRDGSKKGYGVGRRHGRQRPRRHHRRLR